MDKPAANDILDLALTLRSEGISVIPLLPREKKPALTSWTVYQERLPTETEVHAWFDKPGNNIGIVCGKVSGNLAVLDFDDPKKAEAWGARYASAFDGCPIVQTGRGFHVYLRSTVPLRGSKNDQYEVKGEGGYVVGPGSVHPNGGKYLLKNADIAKIPQLDPAILGLEVAHVVHGNGQGKPAGWQDEILAADVPEGGRHSAMVALVGRRIAKGDTPAEVEVFALAVNGRWTRPLPEEEVREIVRTLPATHERNHSAEEKPPRIDHLAGVVSFAARQEAEISPRTWYVDGMICPGFNMLTSRKAMGKSFFLMQMANAIAEGQELLGRKTVQAKVLLVSFELDERDTSERFKGMLRRLSENAYIMHAWSTGEDAFADAERAIAELGFKVIIFDTFLPMLPRDPDFKLNEYGDSEIYLRWRLLAKRHEAAIVASWHEGKTPRDDFMLNAIGSTGMVAQADSVISIDRKRGDAAGKLFIAGNHAKDSALSVIFEDGFFRLGEGEISIDRLTRDEEKTLAALAKHPEGVTPVLIGLEVGKSEDAARKALQRLEARRKIIKIKRGVYGLPSHDQSEL